MGHWSESSEAKSATIGTRFEVSGADFSFTMSTAKAMTPEQIGNDLKGIDIPEGGKVWPVRMANTLVDRHNERFSKAYLEAIAKQLNGATETFNLFHERQIPIGKVLNKAELVLMPNGTDYEMRGYVWVNNKAIVPSQPDITVNEAIETGTLKDVSVEVGGTVQFVDAPQGSKASGVWEWYIDPERPHLAEMTGMGLVQKGAQRGAAVGVKSIGGQPIKEKEATITDMYKDKFFVNNKEYAVSAKQEGTEIKAEGIQALVDDYKVAVTEKQAAEAEKSKAENAQKAVEAEIKEVRDSLISEIELTEKALTLPNPSKKEDLEKMKAADLMKKAADLRKQYDGGPEHREKSAFTTTEAY